MLLTYPPATSTAREGCAPPALKLPSADRFAAARARSAEVRKGRAARALAGRATRPEAGERTSR